MTSEVEVRREMGASLGGTALPVSMDRQRHDVGPRRLRFDLAEIEVEWDADHGTLWSFMTPSARACFSLTMLRDLKSWQDAVVDGFADRLSTLKYLVLGSRAPGVFSLGGDLDRVLSLVQDQDVDGLTDYARLCTRILHRNLRSLDLDVVTICLLQGDAVGGGVETALSFDVVIAERQVVFSLPESAFGLFPGVGAHSILTRRLGASAAERMILESRSYTADEMHAMGLVHLVTEKGEGETATAAYIRNNVKRQRGQVGVYRAARAVNPVTLDELDAIARIWAETAVALNEDNISVMRRLALLQTRRSRSGVTMRA